MDVSKEIIRCTVAASVVQQNICSADDPKYWGFSNDERDEFDKLTQTVTNFNIDYLNKPKDYGKISAPISEAYTNGLLSDNIFGIIIGTGLFGHPDNGNVDNSKAINGNKVVFKFHGLSDVANSFASDVTDLDTYECSVEYNKLVRNFFHTKEAIAKKVDELVVNNNAINQDTEIIIFGHSLGVFIGNCFRKALIDKGYKDVNLIAHKGFFKPTSCINEFAPGLDSVVKLLVGDVYNRVADYGSNYKLLSEHMPEEYCLVKLENNEHEITPSTINACYNKYKELRAAGKKNVAVLAYSENDNVVGDGMLRVYTCLANGYDEEDLKEPKFCGCC